MSRGRNNLANNGQRAAKDDMEAMLVGSSAVPRVDNGVNKGSDIRWRGQKKRFHSGISKSLHNGREEVCR